MLRRGSLIYALLVFLAGASLMREASVGRLARFDENWWALLAKYGTPEVRDSKLTLVEITGETLAKHPWPWRADDFALFFHAVLPFQPAVLAVEPPMISDPGSATEDDPVFEKMLHDHVLRSPKLVLGGRLGFATDPDTVQELQPMPVLRQVQGDISAVPDYAAIESWAGESLRLTTQPGWTNFPERKGPRGWCPLVLRYRGQPVPTMVLQLLMHSEKVTLDEVGIMLGSHADLGSAMRVPVDASGRMLLNVGARFDRVSYDDLLLSREQLDRKETPVIAPDLFSNRVVMLARTDDAARTITLPDGRRITPGEFVASGFASAEIRSFPRHVGEWFGWTLVGIAAFFALWIRKWRPVACVVITLLTPLALAGVAWWKFRTEQLLLPALVPIGLAVWVLLLRLVARRIEKIIAF